MRGNRHASFFTWAQCGITSLGFVYIVAMIPPWTVPFRTDDGTCKPPYFRQICFMICLRSPEISTLRRWYCFCFCFCFCCYRCYRIELLHELSRRLVTGLRSIREPLTSSASMNPELILGCVGPFRLEGKAFSGRQLLRIKFSHFDRSLLKRWTNLSLSLPLP